MDSTTEQTVEPVDEKVRIQATVAALRTLLEGDEQQQRATFKYLQQALEEDRPSNRRRFQ
jgi:hypothetical protein